MKGAHFLFFMRRPHSDLSDDGFEMKVLWILSCPGSHLSAASLLIPI